MCFLNWKFCPINSLKGEGGCLLGSSVNELIRSTVRPLEGTSFKCSSWMFLLEGFVFNGWQVNVSSVSWSCGKTAKRRDKCYMCNFLFQWYINSPIKQDSEEKKNYPASQKAVLLEVSTFPDFPAGFVFPFDFLRSLRLWVLEEEKRFANISAFFSQTQKDKAKHRDKFLSI